MRRLTLLCCAAFLAACAPAEEEETFSLADVAGSWSMEALQETGDSVIVTMNMTATDSYDGWAIMFSGREPIAARVLSVEGDSIVTEFGPYESALRAGVMVTTRSVMRLVGEDLVGTFVARYETMEADSVLRGRLRGMRAQ